VGSHYDMIPAGQGHVRASSAERERAIDVLKAAFAEGRLDQDEYADRVDGVYRSKTYGELAMLVADLPVGPFGSAGPVLVAPQTLPAARSRVGQPTNGMAIAALILGLGAFPTLGATALPAIVLGLTAYSRASHNRQRGRLMAVIGAIAGVLAIPLFVHLLYLLRNG
jgi:hypothetical protein